MRKCMRVCVSWLDTVFIHLSNISFYVTENSLPISLKYLALMSPMTDAAHLLDISLRLCD